MNYHTGLRFQRGGGLGAIFGSLIRGLKPLAKMGLTAGKKFLQSDTAKSMGHSALNFGKQALKDVAINILEGKQPIRDSLNDQLELAKSKVAASLKGGGRRKRRKKTCETDTSEKLGRYNLLE